MLSEAAWAGHEGSSSYPLLPLISDSSIVKHIASAASSMDRPPHLHKIIQLPFKVTYASVNQMFD